MEILKKILCKILGRKEAFFCKCIEICQIYIARICNKINIFWGRILNSNLSSGTFIKQKNGYIWLEAVGHPGSWFNYFPNEWLNDNRVTYLQFDKHTNTHQR